MIAKFFSLFAVIFLTSTALQLEKSARDHLVHDLLDNYHSSVEPSGRIELKFSLSLSCLRYDPTIVKLQTSAWERYSWSDYRLSWNPKDYDGIDKLRLPASLIWKPDIDCYNAIEAEERTSENVLINSEGEVLWIPRALYKTHCSVENDKPVCDLSFGSWTYDHWTVTLETQGEGVDMSWYMNKTCPWLVDSYTTEIKTSFYPCCKEPYATLDIILNPKPNKNEEKT